MSRRNRSSRKRRPITYVEVSFFVHATEDREKALRAARNILPEEHADGIVFTRDDVWGYHKNPISLFKTRIARSTVAKALVARLADKMEETESGELSSNFGRYVGEGKTLYLRLNKQEAYLGNIRLGPADPIRLKIKLTFEPRDFEEVVNAATNA